MYKSINRKRKGFTLIEIVISLILLGFLLTAILPMFINGFSLIFTMGQKTKASNEAQAFIEAVYDKGTDELSNIAATYSSTNVTDPANMNDSQYVAGGTDKQMFHNLTTSGSMNKVTVMLFYNKGKKVVKLSALIP